MERLETQHWPGDPLDEAMVLKERLAPIMQERIAQATAAGIDGQAAYDMLLAEIAKIEAGE